MVGMTSKNNRKFLSKFKEDVSQLEGCWRVVETNITQRSK